MKRIDISTPKYPDTFTLVDDEDFEELSKHKWCALKAPYTFYAVRSCRRPFGGQPYTVRMHRKTGTSEYKGVCWQKRDKKWRAQIQCNGELEHLGYFVHEIEAAEAYDQKAKALFGEFANTNF